MAFFDEPANEDVVSLRKTRDRLLQVARHIVRLFLRSLLLAQLDQIVYLFQIDVSKTSFLEMLLHDCLNRLW